MRTELGRDVLRVGLRMVEAFARAEFFCREASPKKTTNKEEKGPSHGERGHYKK